MVPSPGPELPLDATTVAPVSAALLQATAVEEFGPPAPPSERLITCATGFDGPVSVASDLQQVTIGARAPEPLPDP